MSFISARMFFWTRVLIVIWVLFIALSCFLNYAALWLVDYNISHHCAQTEGYVEFSTPRFTAVKYFTPDSEMHITDQNGVEFPSNLRVNQTVPIEYNTQNYQQVRIANRPISLAIMPLFSLFLGTFISAAFAWLILDWFDKKNRVIALGQWKPRFLTQMQEGKTPRKQGLSHHITQKILHILHAKTTRQKQEVPHD